MSLFKSLLSPALSLIPGGSTVSGAAGIASSLFGGSNAPAGGYAVGQIPNQPSGAAVTNALLHATAAQRAGLLTILQQNAPWERGTPDEIMRNGDLMAWLAWGGGNGAVRGAGEQALQSAVSSLLGADTHTALAGSGFDNPFQDVVATANVDGGNFNASASYGKPNSSMALSIVLGLVVVLAIGFFMTRKKGGKRG